MRITNNLIMNSVMQNINNNLGELLKYQNQLSSGKAISKPSDDPITMVEILNYRSILESTEQHIRNIEMTSSNLGIYDSVMGEVENLIIRAQEIAVSQSNATATAATRSSYAIEIQNLYEQCLSLGNTKVGNQYIFGGFTTNVAPFSSAGVYFGDSGVKQIEVGNNVYVQMNIVGSDFLTTDLDPDISATTALDDLNRGNGINNGSFKIIDREGNSGTVTFTDTSTMDITDVINDINGLSGVNVTATINSNGTGILLTDTSSTPSRRLEVQEVGGGQVAQDLGILGYGSGTTLNGDDLDPQLSTSTSLSLLNGGSGLTLTSLHIDNGSLSADVDLSSATTIGDVISAINASGTNSSASITFGGVGASLNVASTDSSTTAVVTEVGNGTSAGDLGIQGSGNLLGLLSTLEEALLNNDVEAIQATLDLFDDALQRVTGTRSEIGATTNRLETSQTSLENFQLNITELLSLREDVDIVEVVTKLTSEQNAYEASLSAAGLLTSMTLLDYL